MTNIDGKINDVEGGRDLEVIFLSRRHGIESSARMQGFCLVRKLVVMNLK